MKLAILLANRLGHEPGQRQAQNVAVRKLDNRRRKHEHREMAVGPAELVLFNGLARAMVMILSIVQKVASWGDLLND
jgi:type IV secretory pathway TrbD component